MRDEIKATWIIAAVLIGAMGLFSLFSDNLTAQENDIFKTAAADLDTQEIPKAETENNLCDWVSSLQTKS